MLQQRAPQEEEVQEGEAQEDPVAEEQEGGGDGEEARREPQRENSDSSFEELTMASSSGEEEEGAVAREVSAEKNCDNPSAEETVREGIRFVMSNVDGSDSPEGGSGDVENEASSAATESDIGTAGADGGGT